MSSKTIITCAVTGGGDITANSVHVPRSPLEIANECVAAARAGAAVVHVHVRDPETGAPSTALAHYKEVMDRVRSSSVDVLINLTTGPGARYIPGVPDPLVAAPGSTLTAPEQRVEHVLELRPDICSLDVATMNFGNRVLMNAPDHIARMAELVRDAGIRPELEVFDFGHVELANRFIQSGHILSPPLFQLCLGIPGGAPATAEVMAQMRRQLPDDAMWSAFGIGSRCFPMVAQAVILGGHVRVGLEDNLYLRRGELSHGNAPQVERACQIIDLLGGEPATAQEARALLQLA